MLHPLQRQLFPRLDPVELRFRQRLTHAVILASAGFLGLWLVVDLLALALLRPTVDHAYGFDLLAILVMGLVLLVGEALRRRGRIILASYLIATAVFLFPLLNSYFAPQDIYLVAPAYILSVMIAGAVISGGAAFLFAIGAMIASAATWVYAQGQAQAWLLPHDVASAVVFVLSIGLVSLACAAMVTSLAAHAKDSLDLLSSQAEQMANLAHTDPLTSLANRRRLIEQFGREFRRALRYGRPLSLLYLDLDGFKVINDRFGHMFGDEVLQGVGKSMLAVLRSTDLLARVGGEEFAVLLPETGLDGALKVAAKLRRALQAYSLQLGPAVPALTFSAGISQLHDQDNSFEDMLARADSALYLAKSTGKAHARTEDELPAAEAASNEEHASTG